VGKSAPIHKKIQVDANGMIGNIFGNMIGIALYGQALAIAKGQNVYT
jgi:hypothetical protein